MPDIGTILAVDIEARINKLEKSMARASDVTAKGFNKIEQRAKQSSQRLETEMAKAGTAVERINRSLLNIGGSAFSTIGQNALLALAPVLTLGAAINGTKAALDQFGDIADKSATAGVDPEFFQGIAYAAKLSGVEIDQVAAALATFAKNAGLAAAGRGDLVEKLKLLDPELLKNITLATTQEQRVRLVADAIRKAGEDQAKAAAIASAAFGDAGVKLVAAFKDGGAAIDQTIAKAKEMGIIVDRDVIAHADELGDKFDTMNTIVGQQLRTSLVNLAPVLVGLSGYVADWTRDLNIVVDQLKDIEDRTVLNPLQNNLVAVENERATLLQEISGLQAQLETLDPTSGFAGTITGEINEKAARAEALMKQALQYQERIAELQGKPKGSTPAITTAPQSPVLTPERTTGGSAREDHRAAAGGLRDGTSLDQAAGSLDHVATAASASTIAIAGTSNAIDRLGERLDQMQGLAQSFVGDLLDGTRNGVGLVENLANAFGDLGDELLRFAANEAIKSIFATLTAGPIAAGVRFTGGALGFAAGGYTGPGGRNTPAGIVHRGEVVWSQDDVARHGGPAVVDALRRLPGFANGGAVGKLASRPAGVSIGGTSISIAPNISVAVEGGSRGPEADAAMGKVIATEIDNRVRGLVTEQLIQAMRPGNLLNNGAV